MEKLANSITNEMFADRETLKEAFEYVADVAKGSDSPIAVWTAVMVVCNTIANEMRKVEGE